MKIVILLPHNYPQFDKKFIMSLLGVICSFHEYNATVGNKHKLGLLVQNEGPIDFMRENLAEDAIKAGYDYLLWMDTDMLFPPQLIQRFIQHFEAKPELEAITGLYVWKQPPFMPHVYPRFNEKTGKFTIGAWFPLKKTLEVAASGFGCLMIKRNVFERVEKPWFEMKIEGREIKYGEDLNFFKKAQPIKMICDPQISCGHISEISIDINSYIQYNDYKIENDEITGTEEQLQKVSDEHIGYINRLKP